MRLFSYKVARDFGFAPNPFFGYCTLANCMTQIRRTANLGDWIAGIGSQSNKLNEKLIYAMKVSETLTFDEYFNDERFQRKKPKQGLSLRQAFGDNIYYNVIPGEFAEQLDSHHSLSRGLLNGRNIRKDTSVNRVLISEKFLYWGDQAIEVPELFRAYNGYDIVNQRQGHKCRFPEALPREFEVWMNSFERFGVLGRPQNWKRKL